MNWSFLSALIKKGERKLKQILSALFFFLFWFVTFRVVNAFVDLFLQYSLLMDLFIILLTGVTSLVLAKLAFDMLARQEHKHLSPKRRALIVAGLAILFASTFAFNYWNDHWEKTVQSALSKYSKPEEVTLFNHFLDDWRILKNEKEIDQLMNFIGQYKVKMGESPSGPRKVYEMMWDNDPLLFGPSKVTIRVTKDRIMINENKYQVVNGPVDMQWLEQYYEKNQEEPG